MSKKSNIESKFKKIASDLEEVHNEVKKILPELMIKEATSFGNSSHVVLSKSFLNKKVGVVLLSEDLKNEYSKT